MSEADARSATQRPHAQLEATIELLQRQKLVERVAHNQHGPHQDRVETLVHRQNQAELQRHLAQLHPADIAYILEALPLADRLAVWQRVKADRDGEILLEVSDAVRESLIADMDDHEILAAVEPLDADALADLVEDLPTAVLPELMASLDAQQRERVQSALSYRDDQVGALMDFEMVTIREDVTLEVVLRYLRRFDELPEQTDKLFVANQDNLLTGVLPLKWLLLNVPDTRVGAVMARDVNTFHPDDDAYDAAQAFERYELVSAPVVEGGGRLVGRLTIEVMVDPIRDEGDSEMFGRAGLREGEDIFPSVWASLRNRWSWLAINLVTAFLTSRVIGLFQVSIEKLVVLASLMPVVASIGGSSGNQTVIKIVRAVAMEHGRPWFHPGTVAQSARGGVLQWPDLGRSHRHRGGADVSRSSPGCGGGGGHGARATAGRLHGERYPDADGPPGTRSGDGLEHVPRLHDRQWWVLHFPGAGDGVPDALRGR